MGSIPAGSTKNAPLAFAGGAFLVFQKGKTSRTKCGGSPDAEGGARGRSPKYSRGESIKQGALHFAAVSYFAMGIVIPGGPEQKISVDESCLLRGKGGPS